MKPGDYVRCILGFPCQLRENAVYRIRANHGGLQVLIDGYDAPFNVSRFIPWIPIAGDRFERDDALYEIVPIGADYEGIIYLGGPDNIRDCAHWKRVAENVPVVPRREETVEECAQRLSAEIDNDLRDRAKAAYRNVEDQRYFEARQYERSCQKNREIEALNLKTIEDDANDTLKAWRRGECYDKAAMDNATFKVYSSLTGCLPHQSRKIDGDEVSRPGARRPS